MKRPTVNSFAGVVGWILGLVLVLTLAVLVWGSWITPFERVAMRKAITDIETLERMQGSEADYQGKILATKSSVLLCKKRAITEYDSRVTMLIEMDLRDAILRKKIVNLPDTDSRKPLMMKAVSEKDGSIDAMLRQVIQ